MWQDRFFYMLYFQEVGPAERELEADVRQRTAHRSCGAAPARRFTGMPAEFPPAEGTGFLDMFSDIPDGLPFWLTEADLDHYVEQFTESGFFGPVSYYRNLDANYEVLKDVPIERVAMPSFFIGGDKDAVIAGRPEYVDGDERHAAWLPRQGDHPRGRPLDPAGVRRPSSTPHCWGSLLTRLRTVVPEERVLGHRGFQVATACSQRSRSLASNRSSFEVQPHQGDEQPKRGEPLHVLRELVACDPSR